jgi:hypothetical protein
MIENVVFDPKCHYDHNDLKKRVSDFLLNMDGPQLGVVKEMVDAAWLDAVDDAMEAMAQTSGDC